MKKNLVLIAIFMVTSFIVFGQTITVTAPNSGTTWNSGSTYDITWRSSGCRDTSIKINIFRNSITAENFIEQLTCTDTGMKSWPIPRSYTTGNYIMRIKTADELCRGDSQIFQITAIPSLRLPENTVMETRSVLPAGSRPVIKVVYPNGGETLTRGSRVEIRWECVDGFNPPRIKIQKNGRTIREYSSPRVLPVPSRDGYIWPWFVPSDLAPGSDYKIRIEKGDFARSNDKSDNNFTISSDLNIEVVEPRGGGLIATNGKIIRWRAGGVDGNVNVNLQRADGRGGLQLIRSNVPVTPSHFLWYVGTLERAGTIISRENYKILVSAADGSVTGESNSFQIIIPSLEVTSPGSSRKRLGDTLNIRWNNSPGFHGNVKVTLEQQMSGGTFTEYEILFANTHDKSLSWRIPPRSRHGEIDPFPTDRNYRIVVRSIRCPNLIIARGVWFEVR